MRRDATYHPGEKTRCEQCQLVITLAPVEDSPFPRWQWTSKSTGTDCRPKNPHRTGAISHRPKRPTNDQARAAVDAAEGSRVDAEDVLTSADMKG